MYIVIGCTNLAEERDFRDYMAQSAKTNWKLFPYAKDLHYHEGSRTISMTVEMYTDTKTQEFTFGFTPSGKLKDFLDQLWDGDYSEEN
jgi:hypothetical protein